MKKRWTLIAYALALLLSAGFCRAEAHPLGNFTVNRLIEVRSTVGALEIRVFVDRAEIPTFQLMQQATSDRARSERTRASVDSGLHVWIDGTPASLTFLGANGRLRPGAANLPTYYWSGRYTVALQPGEHQVRVVDDIEGDRLGWRDIVAGDRVDPTRGLTAYPSDLLASPRNVTSLEFASDGATLGSVRVGEEAENGGTSFARTSLLSDMFADPNRAPLFVLLTVLVAFGLGALHALEPGHGKALLAFTLVGARATWRQALILAGALTVAHTAAVFVLGFVLFFATGFAPESIYSWITLISGAAIAVIGARSLGRYVASLHPHAHGGVAHDHRDGHFHEHTHDHHHGDSEHGHSHAIPGEEPLRFGSAIWAAMSGGIAPCPAAIVVLLAALRMHQLGYGMALIVVFSLGLASVLSALGLGVVHASAWLGRTRGFDRVARYGPLASALLISVVGAVMLGQGFSAEHISMPQWSVIALTLVAIAGYALTANHTHTHHHATEPA